MTGQISGWRINAGARLLNHCSILLLAVAVVAFVASSGAQASDDSWSIVETKGDVQVLRAGFQPVALTDGAVLRPGDRIVTTGNGRAIINRGKDTIIVAPNSEIGLPALKRPGWGTRIIQEIGTIFLKVESSAERRFEVETPVLAAVVKGTRFTVSANPTGAAVHVLEGAVEVSAFASQQTGLVMPGQTATLDNRPGGSLEIDGNEAQKGGAAKSFERTLDKDEPSGNPSPSANAPGIERVDSTPGLGRSVGASGVGPAVLKSAVVGGARSDAAKGPGSKRVEARAIKVSLGNTEVNLRQVTRGLVRNVVAQEATSGGKKADEGKPGRGSSVVNAAFSNGSVDTESGEGNGQGNGNGAANSSPRAAAVSNGLPSQGGGLSPGFDEGGAETAGLDDGGSPDFGGDTGGVAPGLADTGGVAPGLADTGGVPPGLADSGGVPAGLSDSGGVPAGLSDTGGVPAGLSDTGGVPPGLADSGGVPTGLGDTGGVPPGLVDTGDVSNGNGNGNAGGNGNGNGGGNGNGNGNKS